jgi:hypothetical protein
MKRKIYTAKIFVASETHNTHYDFNHVSFLKLLLLQTENHRSTKTNKILTPVRL